MTFPPLFLGCYEFSCELTALLRQEVKRTFGRAWQIIHHTAHQLYQLILLINKIASSCFAAVQEDSHPSPNPEFRNWKPLEKEKKYPRLNAQALCEFDSQEEDDSPYFPRNLNCEDPLNSMGAIAPLDPAMQLEAIDDENMKNGESLDLSIIDEIVKPAQDLLKKMEISKPKTLQNYLNLTEQLSERHLLLQQFASTFEKTLPKGHELIQKTRESLETTRDKLEQQLSTQMKSNYQRNRILSDGHCLFRSIADQMENKKEPERYRQLAADFIRNNAADFKSGITDAASLSDVKKKMESYSKTQGKEGTWVKNLENTLGRTPTKLDFYCDCLENSNLWGGINEIMALSEVLEVPFLVFTQRQKTWRLEFQIGLSKFQKRPILLYYNGTNHYQSLIPK